VIDRKSKYLGTPLFLLAILIIWQAVAFGHRPLLEVIWGAMALAPPAPDWKFLSSPLEILAATPQELKDGALTQALGRTTAHCLIAFIIAWIVGLPLARALVSSRLWRHTLLPVVHGLSGIPPVTLLPLLLIAFGLDSGSVIALAIFGALLSITLVCYEAQAHLNSDFGGMIANLGYSRLAVWLWELSAVSGELHTAAREGLRWSLILSVVGEMHGSVAGGLGAYVDSGRLNQNYAVVYIGVIACGALSAALKVALDWAAYSIHTLLKRFLLGAPFHSPSIIGTSTV